jgi:hypothetical protein
VTKISQLSSIGDSLAIGDQFLIRDIDDAGSPNKSVTVSGITRALADGDATAPALAFAADKNTGIYRAGTDSLAVATNGTGRLFVDASGRVGIGVGSPVTALQVVGTATFGNGIGGRLQATTDSNLGFIDSLNNTSTEWQPLIQRGTEIQFHTNTAGVIPVEKVRITSAGLVGIGTSSPDERLHVKATGTQRVDLAKFELAGQRSLLVQGQWGAMDIGTSNGILQYTSGNLGFRTSASGNANMLLDISGRVGIGSTTVDEHLHIEGIGTH